MLWDLVFLFYVQYIFGGSVNGSTHRGILGQFADAENLEYVELNTANVYLPFSNFNDTTETLTLNYYPIGNYLSLIATIITMIFIIILSVKLVMFCFNIFRRVID